MALISSTASAPHLTHGFSRLSLPLPKPVLFFFLLFFSGRRNPKRVPYKVHIRFATGGAAPKVASTPCQEAMPSKSNTRKALPSPGHHEVTAAAFQSPELRSLERLPSCRCLMCLYLFLYIYIYMYISLYLYIYIYVEVSVFIPTMGSFPLVSLEHHRKWVSKKDTLL